MLQIIVFILSFCHLTALAEMTQTLPPTSEVHTIPLTPAPQLWSKAEKILRFQCKDYKLIARSRYQPSKTFTLSTGLSNDKNCKSNAKAARTSGCFCDDQVLKCLVTKKIEPKGIVCPNLFLCFAWEGDAIGQMQIETIGKHYTRQACEKELAAMFLEDE